jgi:hypothetical protein
LRRCGYSGRTPHPPRVPEPMRPGPLGTASVLGLPKLRNARAIISQLRGICRVTPILLRQGFLGPNTACHNPGLVVDPSHSEKKRISFELSTDEEHRPLPSINQNRQRNYATCFRHISCAHVVSISTSKLCRSRASATQSLRRIPTHRARQLRQQRWTNGAFPCSQHYRENSHRSDGQVPGRNL